MNAEPPTAIVWTRPVPIRFEKAASGLSSLAAVNGRQLSLGWEMVAAKLAGLRSLRDCWDGDKAVAPSRELLNSVEWYLSSLRNRCPGPASPTRIAASVDGIVALEWQLPPVFATIEIAKPGEGAWLIERPGYKTEYRVDQWPVNDDALRLSRVDQWLFAGDAAYEIAAIPFQVLSGAKEGGDSGRSWRCSFER